MAMGGPVILLYRASINEHHIYDLLRMITLFPRQNNTHVSLPSPSPFRAPIYFSSQTAAMLLWRWCSFRRHKASSVKTTHHRKVDHGIVGAAQTNCFTHMYTPRTTEYTKSCWRNGSRIYTSIYEYIIRIFTYLLVFV